MIVITTPTGQIGSKVLAGLEAAGESVRAIARDPGRVETKGSVELIEGTHADSSLVARALEGAEAVFWCVPPDETMTAPAREYYLRFCRPLAEALPGSSVRRLVLVSSGGRGGPKDSGPIGAALEVEELLESTGVHLRALRCGYFMENLLSQVEMLRDRGIFAHPMKGDIAVPVCATRDIAARAVELLRDRSWTGQTGVGVHGPAHLTLNQMADVMTRVLGRPIRYHELSEADFRAVLLGFGASEVYTRELIDLFRAMAGGLHDAQPRTQDSTTPTSFDSWCAEILRPAIA